MKKFPLSALSAVLCCSPYAYAENSEATEYLSFTELAPSMLGVLMRSNNYYGNVTDENEKSAPISDRQFILGSADGYRDKLIDNGIFVNGGITQVGNGVVSGDGDSSKYSGSADLYVALDTGKANWWSGGLFFAHLENSWGNTVTGTGSILPSNYDAVMPSAEPGDIALSELYYMQGLPNGWSATIGKIAWTSIMETNMFANDERNQFIHTGLVNNAILGAFVPYTSLGVGIFREQSEELSYGMIYTSNSTNAVSSGFDKLKSSEMTLGGQVTWSPTFDSKPGEYTFLVGATNKDTVNFNVDDKHLIEELLGIIPADKKDNNWAVAVNAAQYLWVDSSAQRADGQPVGVGLFARWGTAPKDRNVIDQFFSFGVSGNGGLFSRVNDNWGIGWAGTHFSKDLRRDLSVFGADLDSQENAYEAYYNLAITPGARLSFHAQYLSSASSSVDDPVVLGTRLQLDF